MITLIIFFENIFTLISLFKTIIHTCTMIRYVKTFYFYYRFYCPYKKSYARYSPITSYNVPLGLICSSFCHAQDVFQCQNSFYITLCPSDSQIEMFIINQQCYCPSDNHIAFYAHH